MNRNDAFDVLTKSFRHVRLMSHLQDSWSDRSRNPAGHLLHEWLLDQQVGNLAEFSFLNQHILISHLYMMLVWYAEHARRGIFDDLFGNTTLADIHHLAARYNSVAPERRPAWPELESSITKWTAIRSKQPEPRTIAAYFGHLRNSVAHGRVDILPDGTFLFTDADPGKSVNHTEINLSFGHAARIADATYLSIALDVYPI